MRLSLQIFLSVLVFGDAVNARYISHRGVESRGHTSSVHGRRSRSLKKGSVSDDDGDYYYISARHNKNGMKGKEKEANVPSVAPHHTSPISPAPTDENNNNNNNNNNANSQPTHAPQQYPTKGEMDVSVPPPKKKLPDRGKKGMDMNSKKLSGGKGSVTDDDDNDDNGGGDDDGGGGGMGPCSSHVALQLSEAVPEIITVNPISCCYSSDTEVVAIYITHALPSKYTTSGFEPFWDQIYNEIEQTSRAQHVCFVMTGVNRIPNSNSSSSSSDDDDDRSLEQVLFETISFASELSNVAAIMTTDPTTENTNIVDEVRRIYNNTDLPAIGVFNAGYNNIIIESIVRNDGRLPYIGTIDEAAYGRMAAQVTRDRLSSGVAPVPLCFNARIGVIDFLGDRCVAYYNELMSSSSSNMASEIGVPCGPNSTRTELITLLNDTSQRSINAVWAPLDCCGVVTDAVETIRASSRRRIVVGCQDDDPTNGRIDFYTAAPIALQGYMAASWATFPVLNEGRRRKEPFFPSLQSLIHTAVFNTIVAPSSSSSS